nr:hypothetical protein [uncultured Rhodopila sp.]
MLSNRSDARRDSNVREWLRRYSRLIRISVVTIAEMHRGLLLLEARIAAADGKPRNKMTAALRSKRAWYDEVLAVFGDRIEPIGLDVAQRAGCVLIWISLAIARHNYRRIGPETDLRARVAELQAYYDAEGISGEPRDTELLKDTRQMLLDSCTSTTPINREINQRRYRFRARAASHLVRSLIWALTATTVIFVADKPGYLPKVNV